MSYEWECHTATVEVSPDAEGDDAQFTLSLALIIAGISVGTVGIVLLLIYLWTRQGGRRQTQRDMNDSQDIDEQAALRDVNEEDIADYKA